MNKSLLVYWPQTWLAPVPRAWHSVMCNDLMINKYYVIFDK